MNSLSLHNDYDYLETSLKDMFNKSIISKKYDNPENVKEKLGEMYVDFKRRIFFDKKVREVFELKFTPGKKMNHFDFNFFMDICVMKFFYYYDIESTEENLDAFLNNILNSV